MADNTEQNNNKPETGVHTSRVLRMVRHFTKFPFDVHFRFVDANNEEKIIEAHALWLLTMSPVFEELFKVGEWHGKNLIDIEDAKYTIFDQFVKYIYGIDATLDLENIDGLLYLAKKYKIDDLVTECVDFIAKHLSVDYVIPFFEMVLKHQINEHRLKMRCVSIIHEKTHAVLDSKAFVSCDKSFLKRILKFEKLSCGEERIFDACIDWASQKCKENNVEVTAETLREQLGDCFDLIRFGEMKQPQLFQRLEEKHCRLFTADELCDLMVKLNHNNGQMCAKRNVLTQSKKSKVSRRMFYFNFRSKDWKNISVDREYNVKFSISERMRLKQVHFPDGFVHTVNRSGVDIKSVVFRMHTKDGNVEHSAEMAHDIFYFAGGVLVEKNDICEIVVTFQPTTKYCPDRLIGTPGCEWKSQTLNGLDLYIDEQHLDHQNEHFLSILSGICFTKPE